MLGLELKLSRNPWSWTDNLSFGHELTLNITLGLKLHVIFGLGLILELWS
jgi:hypothetical protein